MATIKLVLDTRRKRKDQYYPLVFRLSHRSKTRELGTGVYLMKSQFNKELEKIVSDDILNDELQQKLLSHKSKLRSVLLEQPDIDVQALKECLINSVKQHQTINSFWKEEIKRMTNSNRHGGVKVYMQVKSALENVIDFNIPFHDLTYQKILEIEEALFLRGMSRNGVNVYLRTLRAVCNKAINYDLVGYEWYPFRKYKFRKDKTTPRVLSLDEVRAYFSLNLSPTHIYYKSWLVGKLIFMLRGINVKDLLLLSSDNIKNGRIIYKRAKTGKIYSIKLTDEVKEVLEQFEPNSTLLGLIKDNDLKNKERLIKVIMQRRKVINTHCVTSAKSELERA